MCWLVLVEVTDIFLNVFAQFLNTFIISITIIKILIKFLASLFPHLILHIGIDVNKEFHFAKRLHPKVNVDNLRVPLRIT